jgi:AraC family transcriptional regulator
MSTETSQFEAVPAAVPTFRHVDDSLSATFSTSEEGWQGLVAEYYEIPHLPKSDVYCYIDLHIGHVHRGTMLKEIGSQKRCYVYHPGTIVIYPAGLPMTSTCQQVAATAVDLKPHLIAADDFGPAASAEIIPQIDIKDHQIERLMMCVYDELRSGFPAGRLFGDSLGAALTAHILSRYSVKSLRPRPARGGLAGWQVRRVIEMIDASLGDDISLVQLAHSIGLSPWYFSRAFKQSTGLSPHRWMRQHRATRAKELLQDRSRPLTDIALELGFSSSSHFCTDFKRSTRMTPSEYRRSLYQAYR